MKHSTKKMTLAALMAAFTCIATMVIKISTPTFGYIHLGDGLVLLCGITLGPGAGSLAAGIGSMFADIFSGYAAWAPATFIIKALTAYCMARLFYGLKLCTKFPLISKAGVIIGGAASEILMTVGYFFYETGLAAISAGGFSKTTLAAGAASSALGIPFNLVQGLTGILICSLLLPIFMKVPITRECILAPHN